MALNDLKNAMSARKQVEAWLDHIREFDKATRDEVIENCAKDKEARAYFVKRYRQECAPRLGG